MKAKTFKSFLREDFEPYKLVILTHSAAGVRDTKSEPAESGTELLKKVGKQIGIQVETADFVGAYTKKEGDKRLLYSFEFDENGEVQLPSSDEKALKYQKPIVCDPKNTIIMPRGLGTLGFTTSRGWYDLVKEFEYDNFFVVNGPVAITTMSSLKIFSDVISLLITLIYLLDLIFVSMYFENMSLSTASALPAGTLFLSAASIINEFDNLSSS